MTLIQTHFPLITLGFNHQKTPINMREQLAFAEPEIVQALNRMVDYCEGQEGAILSTCNRMELYCTSSEISKIKSWLEQEKSVPSHLWAEHAYVYTHGDAVKHLFEVASGLDSMVVGETQILGQVKKAYHLARQAGTLGRRFSKLFHAAFSTAKKVRSHTAIGAHAVSLASAGVHLVRQIFSDFAEKKVLFVGSGDTIEIMARHLKAQGFQQFSFCNRTLSRAEPLAHRFEAEALSLTELTEALWQYDLVVTATASPLPLLGKGVFETAIRKRKHRPMCILDLAVPRDVEKEVADLPDVYCFDLDHLQRVIEQNQSIRLTEAEKAVILVDDAVQSYLAWLEGQAAVSHIRACRSGVDALRSQMQERGEKWLERGVPPDQVLNRILHEFSQKMMHNPTVAMRQAATSGRQDVLDWAKQFFVTHSEKKS